MIRGDQNTNKLFHNGVEIPLERSLKVRNHSPTGFNWAYHGSGPAQSALGLLLHFGATPEEALAWYQDFKREKIAVIPEGDFTVNDEYVTDWLEARRLFAANFKEDVG